MNNNLQDFADPWLRREPLLVISARFAVAPEAWLARMVLIEELWQSQFALSQLSIAHNKLSWWWEEAQRCMQHAPTHPLSVAAAGQPQAMVALCEAALGWLDQPHASDRVQWHQLWSVFAQAASDWVNEGDSRPIWSALALKRQLQYHAKADRYGPSFCDRARLAEHQLRLGELADRRKAEPVLKTLLADAAQSLAWAARAPGVRSALRAYASLQAEQALSWQILPVTEEFRSTAPPILATFRAWWRARAR